MGSSIENVQEKFKFDTKEIKAQDILYLEIRQYENTEDKKDKPNKKTE